MKHLLLFLLTAAALFGASGDLTCTVRPDGYSAIITMEGPSAVTPVSKNFGFTTGPQSSSITNEPTSATPYLTVTSQGYDATGTLGTLVHYVYFTELVRLPYAAEKIPITGSWTGTFLDGASVTGSVSTVTAIVVGNQAGGPHLFLKNLSGAENAADVWSGGGASATASGTGTVVGSISAGPSAYDVKQTGATGVQILVSLHRQICSPDTATFTAPAGWLTIGGVASNARSAAAVTNGSTLGYPLTCGQWDHIAGVCTADRVTGAFSVAFNARQAALPPVTTLLQDPSTEIIACVKFTATGQTSAATNTVTATTQTATIRSATGKYGCAFVATMPVTGFTTGGELVDLRAQVYPAIGNASSVLDTNSYTVLAEEIRGRNKATIAYNTAIKYAYVNQTTGNNTTGTVSTTEATAAGAPHLNIGEAIEDDPTVIKLSAGTHAAIGDISDSQRTSTEWVRVIPKDGESAATVTVIFNSTATKYMTNRFQYEGVTIKLTDTASYLEGAATNSVRFKNCIFDGSGVGQPSRSPAAFSVATYVENCTGDISNIEWRFIQTSTELSATQFDGCDFGSTGTSALNVWWRVMACIGGAGSHLTVVPASSPAPTHDNFLVESNYLRNHSGTVNSLTFASVDPAVMGGSVCNNVVERIDGTTGGAPVFWIKGDGTQLDCRNVLTANNVFTGERCSVLYADQGGATPYYCENNVMIGNLFDVVGTKHDTFNGYALDSRRVWAWPALYGSGWAANVLAQPSGMGGTASFQNEFVGLRSYQPPFNVVPPAQPPSGSAGVQPVTFMQYVNRQSGDGTAGLKPGNGDYRIHAGSPGYRIMMGRVLPYDQNGKPRSKSRDNAGAFAEGGVRPASQFFGL